jgi:hypothetical protein
LLPLKIAGNMHNKTIKQVVMKLPAASRGVSYV